MNFHLARLAPAAVFCLPLLALAATGADPADAKARAPALRYPSAFADYKPWQDLTPADWRAVNDELRTGATKGAGHAGHPLPAPPPANAAASAAKAPAAAKPGHTGHQMHGGKP